MPDAWMMAGFRSIRSVATSLVLVSLGLACSSKPEPPPCNPTTAWNPGALAVPGGATSASASVATVSTVTKPASPFTLEQLLNVRRSLLPRAIDLHTFVYLTDPSGTPQLHLHKSPFGAEATGPIDTTLTSFPDRVSSSRVSPEGTSVVFLKDTGGDENDQVWRVMASGGEAIALTASPKVKHTQPVFENGFEKKLGRIAYTSNARNGKDMDLYVQGLPSANAKGVTAEESAAKKPLLELSGSFSVLDFRGDRALLLEQRSNVDSDLWIVDVKTKKKTLLTKHAGDQSWRDGQFSRDGKVVFALTDAGSEFSDLAMVDVGSQKVTTLRALGHDLGTLDVMMFHQPTSLPKEPTPEQKIAAKTADLLTYTVNVDGVEHAEVLRLDDKHKPLEGAKEIPGLSGVISEIDCTDDGPTCFVGIERAQQPPEIYRVDLRTLATDRVTQSDHAGVDEAKLVPEQLLSFKTFDGKSISYFWYAAAHAEGEKLPVVVIVHGGPEAQAQPNFGGVLQYLALSGYGVAVPNVRGSLGYGKSFSHLDDKEKREDSVHDLSELGKVLAQRPDVDAKKIALYGGSYGGYMVLAGLTLYPDQWAAGIDVVGIANFRTFLEQTAPYRRALREAEYGSLAKDGELLDKISPIHKVDKIKAPLFVIHGTHDPRVPIGEATQIVEALKKRGLPVELLTFDDEGHGLSKLKNKLVAYPKVLSFLDQHVGHGPK